VSISIQAFILIPILSPDFLMSVENGTKIKKEKDERSRQFPYVDKHRLFFLSRCHLRFVISEHSFPEIACQTPDGLTTLLLSRKSIPNISNDISIQTFIK
jgi:hypothetical protein